MAQWGTSVAQSVKHLTLGFSSDHDLTVSWVQAGHQALCWQPSPYSHCLCLSQNKSINLKKSSFEGKREPGQVAFFCAYSHNILCILLLVFLLQYVYTDSQTFPHPVAEEIVLDLYTVCLKFYINIASSILALKFI